MANNYYRPRGFGGFSFFPPVIKNLLIINGAIFLLTMLMRGMKIDGIRADDVIYRWFALMPFGTGYFEFWQLVSYQFLHANFMHIFFNMFILWMFGAELENMWGSRKFLFYYLGTGIGAGLFHLVLTPIISGMAGPTIGASGAVYGVLIAFAFMFPDRYIFLYFLIPVKAKYLIGFLIVFEFLAVDSAGSNVAHLAHLGGALIGFLWIMLDKNIHIPLKDKMNISGVFDAGKKKFSNKSSSSSGKSESGSGWSSKKVNKDKFKKESEVEDAEFYDLEETDDISQEEIDRILDKISQSGYQNLTEREKKILFEASKRMK